ncbi:DEAD/DEAH box helicase [Caldalkalibacillus mannanilyticus]|uniref:DEAD/DEAH box helicase n=1 Tax=Caldalkalibacillus mannanilyticus TaxID=1418 RepID=UPI000469C6CD
MVSTFPQFLQKAWEKQGFQEMTAIQAKAIPLIRQGKDLIAESPTGTGKTWAYLLPLLEKIKPDIKQAQVVILAPTRELVMQIHQEVQKLLSGTDLTSASFIGGADIKRQVDKLKSNPRIVVGTPNRIIELNKMKKLKMHEVKSIVVDEVDQMLSLGFMDHVQEVIKTTLKDRQLLFFSATVPAKIEQMAEKMMMEPETIRIARSELAPSKVEHMYLICEPREKVDYIRRLVRMNSKNKALAFINETNTVGQISAKLEFMGIKHGVLDGLSSKTERESILNHFREGRIELLLATDIAARGLDIEGLTHVIQVDLPANVESYIHRSGRTGRMGAEGTVITLISKFEESSLKKYAQAMSVELQSKKLYGGKLENPKPSK